MPKDKKKKIIKENDIIEVQGDIEPEDHEDLPDDVKEALGVKKKARVKHDPTDYIPELEGNWDESENVDTGFDETFEDF